MSFLAPRCPCRRCPFVVGVTATTNEEAGMNPTVAISWMRIGRRVVAGRGRAIICNGRRG